MKLRTCFAPAAAIAVSSAGLLASSPARAHINMLSPIQARGGDEKSVPCDGTRADGPVYTFEPGATITLNLEEVIVHDSYFRIAFDNDGQDGFKEPASIAPINATRVTGLGGSGTPKEDNPGCMTDSADKCGPSDFCNNSAVLWDNIDPHLSGESAGSYTWTIQLPNNECENCVLQVLQVMEDIAFGFHGPFDGNADIYHRCIDIKLKKGAGTSGPGNAPGATIKVGTPGSKYPEPNKNCLGGPTPTGDAGAGNDASIVSNDAGQSDSGSPSGTAGGTGGFGGSSGGVAGGTGIAGGVAGATGGGTGVAGGTGIGGGGTTTGGGAAGTGGPLGGGATSGTVPPGDENPNDGGCDCTVSDGSPRYGNLISMSLLALGLLVRRRRLQRR